MRYQIYEAKSVKYDAQQRVGIISGEPQTLVNSGFAMFRIASWQRFGNI